MSKINHENSLVKDRRKGRRLTNQVQLEETGGKENVYLTM